MPRTHTRDRDAHLREGDADREARLPGVPEVPHDERDEGCFEDEEHDRADEEYAKVLVDELGADDEADAREEESRKHIPQLQCSRGDQCGRGNQQGTSCRAWLSLLFMQVTWLVVQDFGCRLPASHSVCAPDCCIE